MGQINLYRIDDNKQSDFEDNIDCKFEFLGEQNITKIVVNSVRL